MIYSMLYWTYTVYIYNILNIYCITYNILCYIYISRVGCHFLLQGIFLTLGSNSGLLHCRQILHHLNHQGSPIYIRIYVYGYIIHTHTYICIYVYVYIIHTYAYMHIIFSLSFHLPQTLRLSSASTIANNAATSI